MAPGLVTAEKAARGKLPTDVWWHTIVSPTGREKTGYPTQKPEGILRRMVAGLDPAGRLGPRLLRRQRHDRRGRPAARPPVRPRRRQPEAVARDACPAGATTPSSSAWQVDVPVVTASGRAAMASRRRVRARTPRTVALHSRGWCETPSGNPPRGHGGAARSPVPGASTSPSCAGPRCSMTPSSVPWTAARRCGCSRDCRPEPATRRREACSARGPGRGTVRRDEQDDDSAAAAPAPAGGMSDPNALISYPGDVSPSPTAAAAPLGPAAVATGVDAAGDGRSRRGGQARRAHPDSALGGSARAGARRRRCRRRMMPPTEMPPTEMPPTEAVAATEPNIQVNPDSLQGVDPMADTLPNPLDNLDQNPQGSWTQQAGPAENAAGNAAGTAAEDAAGPLGEAVPQTLRSAGVNAGQAAGTRRTPPGPRCRGWRPRQRQQVLHRPGEWPDRPGHPAAADQFHPARTARP